MLRLRLAHLFKDFVAKQRKRACAGGPGTNDVLMPVVLNGSPACQANSTSRSGSATGKVFSSTASTTLNNAVFAPIPSASESTAAIVKPLLLASIRIPKRKSRNRSRSTLMLSTAPCDPSSEDPDLGYRAFDGVQFSR